MRPFGPSAPIGVSSWPRASLAGGQSVMSGRWPSRVWMTIIPSAARGREHGAQRLDDLRQQRDVVAEQLAEAARQQEVALHVDDHERGGRGVELEGYGCAGTSVVMRDLS